MRSRLASNVVWNWAGMGITMLTGFLVAPYLVLRLGETSYGLWILIASMSGYFGLLDLGVRGSVGRYVAYYRARGEHEEVNRTLSTSLVILSGVSLLALMATFVVLLFFFRIFDVPPEYAPAARIAILVIGINLAMTFPVTVFDGVLWGFERFDLLNAVDIPTVLLRTVLTFWLVKGPEDIAVLAWLTLGTTLANEAAKMAISFMVEPKLRVTIGRFTLAHAKQLYGYGFWQFLLQIARQTSAQVGPLVIGSFIAVAAVTPFSMASRLLGYAAGFMVAATGAMTPMATAMHARNDKFAEQHLFLEGGRWCAAFALFAGACLFFLGGPFLELWIGKSIGSDAMSALVILTAGELLAMSQWLTFSMILGKAKHRALALAGLVEGLVAGVGGVIAAKYWGVAGVCVAFGVAAMTCRGVFQMLYASRLLGVRSSHYVMHSLIIPLLVATLPCAILVTATSMHRPSNWPQMFLYGGGFAAIYGVTAFLLLGGLKYVSRQPEAVSDEWAVPEVENVNG